MFIQALILAVANQKFNFQVETNNDDIIFTVIPLQVVPECSGAVEQAHAALSMSLRLTIKSSNNVDETILSELQEYMKSHQALSSNLEGITKEVAEASRAVKQERKDKTTDSKAPKKKEAVAKKSDEAEKSEPAPAQTSTERSTFSL